MRPIRAAAIAVALAAIPAVAVVVFTQEAVGHGTMGTPVSRVYQCYLEGPEAPKSGPLPPAERGRRGLPLCRGPAAPSA